MAVKGIEMNKKFVLVILFAVSTGLVPACCPQADCVKPLSFTLAAEGVVGPVEDVTVTTDDSLQVTCRDFGSQTICDGDGVGSATIKLIIEATGFESKIVTASDGTEYGVCPGCTHYDLQDASGELNNYVELKPAQ